MIYTIWVKGVQVEKIKAGFLLLFYRTPLAYIFLIINFLKQEEAPEELFILTGPEELLPTLSLTLTLLVKFPVYFLHVWLPKVHVEARTTASIILASLLLKTGTYGFSVFNKLYLWWNFETFLNIIILGTLGISFSLIFQRDIKSIIAFRSVLHMNMLFVGFLINENYGKTGRLEIIISHGYISAALFFIIGALRHMYGTRIIYWFKGLFFCRLLLRSTLNTLLFLNSGFPLRMSFWSELHLYLSLVPKIKYLQPFAGILFFTSFLFALRLVINRISGKTQKGKRFLILRQLPLFCSLLNYLAIPSFQL